MIIAVITGHLLLDILFGCALLNLLSNGRTKAETFVVSVLVGIYFETLFAATLLFLGIHLNFISIAIPAMMVIFIAAVSIRERFQLATLRSILPDLQRPRWYEWLLLASIGEKLLFAGWQLATTPTLFDDALRHWSGRARTLFGQVNWSFDPSSPLFLARHIGTPNYPFLTILWRSLSASVSGSWNDTIARVDGVIFFLVIVGTVWLATWRISHVRWFAATVAFGAAAMPLHRWHEAAGYSDIAVEAFVVATVAALLRKEWFLAGILAAGAAWSKNDGLLYLPALVAGVGIMQWRKVPNFLAGFLTLAPWLIFNAIYHLGFSPFRSEITWHPDAPGLLLDVFVNNPTSTILWISILVCLIYGAVAMFHDTMGRGLMATFLISFGSICFVFTSTTAYSFLSDQTTIHRSVMQVSGMAIVAAMYAFSLKLAQILKADAAAKL